MPTYLITTVHTKLLLPRNDEGFSSLVQTIGTDHSASQPAMTLCFNLIEGQVGLGRNPRSSP